MNIRLIAIANLLALLVIPAAPAIDAVRTEEAPASEHPLLAELRAESKQNPQPAAARFWREIESRGTPLVVPVPGDPTAVSATFVWRGSAESGANLALIASFVRDGSRRALRFSNLAGTDVWYLTLAAPAQSRYRYYFAWPHGSVTDPEADSSLEIDGMFWELFADPLSRLRYVDEVDGRQVPTSYFEGPEAPAENWIEPRADVPAGTLETLQLQSAALGNTRAVTIYLPPRYRPHPDGHPYMVLFDREKYLEVVPTPNILDNLIAAGAVPPMIAILVDSLGEEHRGRELTPNPAFATFVTTELLPRVSRDFPLSRDPAQAVVAGSSLGGLTSSYLALRHSDLFGNVLSQSGSYWWYPGVHEDTDETGRPGWLARQYVESTRLPLRFYLDVGRGEGEGMIGSNRLFRDMLTARGYNVFYREFDGDHSYLNWRGTLADGLICLIGVPRADECAALAADSPR